MHRDKVKITERIEIETETGRGKGKNKGSDKWAHLKFPTPQVAKHP